MPPDAYEEPSGLYLSRSPSAKSIITPLKTWGEKRVRSLSRSNSATAINPSSKAGDEASGRHLSHANSSDTFDVTQKAFDEASARSLSRSCSASSIASSLKSWGGRVFPLSRYNSSAAINASSKGGDEASGRHLSRANSSDTFDMSEKAFDEASAHCLSRSCSASSIVSSLKSWGGKCFPISRSNSATSINSSLNAEPLQSQPGYRFPTAFVRILSHLPKRKPKKAKVAVSHNIYWKDVNGGKKFEPQSLADFYDVDSLELSRLDGDASWYDVEETVETMISEGMSGVRIPGYLHGPSRRMRFRGSVTIELLTKSRKQRDEWADQIRARVAPWNLLRQRMKKLAAYSRSVVSVKEPVEELTNQMENVLGVHVDVVRDLAVRDTPSTVVNEIAIGSKNKANDKWKNKFNDLRERMEKLELFESLNAHGTAAVETAATFVGLVEKAEKVAETAEFVADVSKCVAGASTVFQLLVLSARIVTMFAESKRGCLVLPVTLNRTIRLLRLVLRSLAHLMNPTSDVDILHEDFAFDVLQQIVETMILVETQLLRGKGSRLLNAKLVKEVETTMKDLEHRVVTLMNSSNTYINREKIGRLETGATGLVDENHHRPPKCSPFFVGRLKELEDLKEILNSYGSAAIAQYGGVGKTELMSAFAERVKCEGEAPGGIFWVTVDGEVQNVVESLACFVDKFRTKKMTEKERKDPKEVVAELERCLSERNGRWLLCLDNADNPELSGLLDAICALGKPSKKNGWVLLTSRRGEPKLWRRMKSEQRIVLKPMSTEEAMVLLWREIHVLEAKDLSKEAVERRIIEMKKAESEQYDALRELCGYESEYSLGGLPLALVQAGTYIGRFECSLSKYLEMLKEAKGKSELNGVMEKVSHISLVNEEQRSILTTWKISVEPLSSTAYDVLCMMSMLGAGPVPDSVVRGILKRAGNGNESVEWMFRNVFMKELVHGSSLVNGEKGDVFEIHRLARRFVLADMERGSAVCTKNCLGALLAMHVRIGEILGNEGKSFRNLPSEFEDIHRHYLPHLLSIIEHFVLPSSVTWELLLHDLELMEISLYSCRVLSYFGRPSEEVGPWQSLLAILQFDDGNHEIKLRIDSMARHGYVLWEQGNFSEAEAMLKKSLHMHKGLFGVKKHTSLATLLHNLGLVYSQQGRLSEAEEMFQSSLQMRRDIYGHDKSHRSIAASLHSLGLIYEKQGRYEAACSMLAESLQMKSVLADSNINHLDIATLMSNLGSVYEKVEKLSEAASMYKRCLEKCRNLHGRGTYQNEIAASLHGLGRVHRKQGKLSESLSMHRKSLQMYREIYGQSSNHSDIATSLNCIGVVCEKLGKLSEAVAMHRACLKMYREIYGESECHSDIATSLNSLGEVYGKQGKLNSAKSVHEKSLRIWKRIYGQSSNHSDIATSLNSLGLIYEKQGKLRKAMIMYRKSLRMRKEIYGDDSNHSDIATSLNNVASIYKKQGKLNVAVLIYSECLHMRRNIHGFNCHIDIAASLASLGLVCAKQGKLMQAESKFQESLQMYKEIYGFENAHSDISKLTNNLGNVYLSRGLLVDAEIMYQRTLEMDREIYGERNNHGYIAATLNNLGTVYRRQGNFGKALSMHQESLQMYYEIYGHSSTRSEIAAVLNNLGLAYECQGRLTEAVSMHRKSLEMSQKISAESSSDSNIATSMDSLGLVYVKLGNLSLAEPMLESALEQRRRIYGRNSNNTSIATSLNNIGLLCAKRRRFRDANSMFTESLQMREVLASHDSADWDMATLMNNRGQVHVKLGELNVAVLMYERSLEILRKLDSRGTDLIPEYIATTLHILGTALMKQGKLNKALSVQQESLRMRYEIHGVSSNHRDIATTLNSLGMIYGKQGKLRDAESICKKSLKMMKEIYGENSVHCDIATSLNSLGVLYEKRGKLNMAKLTHKKSLQMRKLISDDDNIRSDIATSLYSLGSVYEKLKKLGKAQAKYEESIRVWREIYNPDGTDSDIRSGLNQSLAGVERTRRRN